MNYFLDIKKIKDERHAGSKAVQDVKNILLKNNYKSIKVSAKKYFAIFSFIKLFVFGLFILDKKDVLFIQYPPHYYRYYGNFIVLFKKLKKFKTIVLIHDVTYLRYSGTNYKGKELQFFNKFEYIITHNVKMTNQLYKDGVRTNFIELELFDYITDKVLNSNISLKQKKQIIIAGNLDYNKSTYLYDFIKVSKFQVSLFGPNFNESKVEKNSCFKYYGSLPANELPLVLTTGFGLVWDGMSVEECSGDLGNYLKINNPHKLSLYIAGGIPVFVWKKAAVADFVIKNKIGYVIDNLYQINDILNEIAEEEYLKLKENVAILQKRVLNGEFLESALNKI